MMRISVSYCRHHPVTMPVPANHHRRHHRHHHHPDPVPTPVSRVEEQVPPDHPDATPGRKARVPPDRPDATPGRKVKVLEGRPGAIADNPARVLMADSRAQATVEEAVPVTAGERAQATVEARGLTATVAAGVAEEVAAGRIVIRRFLSKNIPTCLSLSSSFCVAITVT